MQITIFHCNVYLRIPSIVKRAISHTLPISCVVWTIECQGKQGKYYSYYVWNLQCARHVCCHLGYYILIWKWAYVTIQVVAFQLNKFNSITPKVSYLVAIPTIHCIVHKFMALGKLGNYSKSIHRLQVCLWEVWDMDLFFLLND